VSGSTKARIKQSPKRPAEERRRELLDAARSLFLKNGYRETSMDDIARKAGLTKGALYFHFSNKDDILIQLVKSFHVEIVAKIRVLPTRKSSPVDVLRILLEAQHGHGKAPFERFLDFWLQASRIPEIRKFMGAGMSRPFQKAFAEVVDPAYAATPRDRRDLAVMVAAAAEGLGVRQLMGDPEINIPRQLKMLSAMIENLRNENKRTR
jgi:AcrR family transcriptional regulator